MGKFQRAMQLGHLCVALINNYMKISKIMRTWFYSVMLYLNVTYCNEISTHFLSLPSDQNHDFTSNQLLTIDNVLK